MRLLACAASFALLCAPAFAVDTKVWVENEMSDLEKGELTHLSLSSEGRLTLAPVVQEVFDPSVTFLWAQARDSKGNLYVADSANNRVRRISTDGSIVTVAGIGNPGFTGNGDRLVPASICERSDPQQARGTHARQRIHPLEQAAIEGGQGFALFRSPVGTDTNDHKVLWLESRIERQ